MDQMTVVDQFLKLHRNTTPLNPEQLSTVCLLSVYCVGFLKVAHIFASFFMIFSCFLEDI